MELNGYSVKFAGEMSGDWFSYQIDAPDEKTALLWAINRAKINRCDYVSAATVNESDWIKIRGEWISSFVASYI